MLSWNIQGNKPTDLDRLAEIISAGSPDVVVLQEVRSPQARQLAAQLSMTHCWAEKHNVLHPLFPGRAEGAAILTPHEMTSTGDAQISDSSSKRSWRRRIVQWATVVRADASGCRVYNAHLSPHDFVAERLAEATRIDEIIEHHGDAPPAVIAGDLNDAGEPQIIAALPGIEAREAIATNPSIAPSSALDHVLVPPAATDVSASAPAGGAEWARLSDHLPITVRFTLDLVTGR